MIGSIDMLTNISIGAVASIATTGRRSVIAAQALSADFRDALSWATSFECRVFPQLRLLGALSTLADWRLPFSKSASWISFVTK